MGVRTEAFTRLIEENPFGKRLDRKLFLLASLVF